MFMCFRAVSSNVSNDKTRQAGSYQRSAPAGIYNRQRKPGCQGGCQFWMRAITPFQVDCIRARMSEVAWGSRWCID